jgi:hypothetical protein
MPVHRCSYLLSSRSLVGIDLCSGPLSVTSCSPDSRPVPFGWPAANLDSGCARQGRAGHRSRIDDGRDCACSGWSKVVVDLPGNGALETSENVLLGEALRGALVQVGPGPGITVEPYQCNRVQDSVGPPVPAAAESVSVGPTGRGR